MAEVRGSDPRDVLAGIGGSWGWVLFFGILTLLLGILTVSWPGRTLVIVAVLLGIQLIVGGIFRFVAAFAGGDEGAGTRVLIALIGVLSFIVGLYLVRHVLITILSVALILGIFWIVHGSVELFTAISHKGMPGRGLTVFTGILSVIAGIVVLIYPGISLLALAWVLGIWLIVYGVIEVVLSFQLRKLKTQTATA